MRVQIDPRAPTVHPSARILTPLASGETRYEPDGVLEVNSEGRIVRVGSWGSGQAIDLRPWVVMPGLVDLHAHLPQLPHAGLGAGLDLMTWLKRYVFPVEREFRDPDPAGRMAREAFRAFAAAGTTTAVLYGSVFESSLDAAFRAAEEHGIRAVLGKVMMDLGTYNDEIDPGAILEISLEESQRLCSTWHGRDRGRLRYAFSPRFAVSCSPEMLRESARLARETGAYWQTHLSEDRRELNAVRELFPRARDYVDVYERAGGLGTNCILAHAVHLSGREITRITETGSHVAHCPASNLFLASGMMPLARYLQSGVSVGLGSDVGAGPEVSLFSVMRIGAYTQTAMRLAGERREVLGPLDWLHLGTLHGARALGLDRSIGSIEEDKEADLIAVDVGRTAPLPRADVHTPEEIASRLVFRTHPDMVRAAWVRGRSLEGAPGEDPGADGSQA